MNKGLLKLALLSMVCASMPAAMTSCKDYDDDISSLQNQIDALRVDVDKFVGLIEGGKVITDVKATEDGVVFTLNDGKSYSISNGKDGQPGTAWTIGEDGYWYKDGAKTEYRAIGEAGAVGPQGPKGDNGAAGQNGEYYVPNAETGFFDIYRDGKKIGSSDIKWSTSSSNGGVVAVYSGNHLTLKWIDKDGKEQSKDILIGNQLGTLAFVPSVLSTVGGYPTTDKPFYHIENYLDEAKYNPTTSEFIDQTNWNRSNEVMLEYRISPQDAYIPNESMGSFINRVVTSRAEGDKATLMNVASFDPEKANSTGVLEVKATINKTAVAGNGNDIAAFQLWNGQVPFTTDYIAPKTSKIENVIVVDPVQIKANVVDAEKKYFQREYSILGEKKESSEFIQKTVEVKLGSPYSGVELVYNSTLDLATRVDLYSPDKGVNAFLTDLGFNRDCISYEFSLPAEYLSDDVQHTNQQWFVQLDGSVLKVNEKNLNNGRDERTAAIDRTPVVRVDAFMMDNLNQNKRLVASAYIKVKIVRAPSTPQTPAEDIKETISATGTYNYHALKAVDPADPKTLANATMVGQMKWEDVNRRIYGAAGLTANTFWNNYGGANDKYTVEIRVKNGSNNELINSNQTTAYAGQEYKLAQDGLFCMITLGNSDTQTSNIRFDIDNKIHTGNKYASEKIKVKVGNEEVSVMAAKYTVTITIPVDDSYKYTRGNVILTQDFYVYEICPEYAYNPSYYNDKLNALEVIGRVVNNKWEMSANIGQLFENRGTPANPIEIFNYFNKNLDGTPNNVSQIVFTKKSPDDDVVTFKNNTIALAKAIEEPVTAVMNYTLTLVNGEQCFKEFKVVFTNPFLAGSINGVQFNGNTIGLTEIETRNRVNVIDYSENKAIYSWSASENKLELSKLATNGYKLKDGNVEVEYDFDYSADCNTFRQNLDPDSKFDIDANGKIIYENKGGSKLQREYNFNVIATVTFKGISIVKCYIPVKVKTAN